MRRIVLTAAALAGFATPAFADLTLPVSSYPQAGGAAYAERDASQPAYDAVVEPSTHFFTGHPGLRHGRSDR